VGRKGGGNGGGDSLSQIANYSYELMGVNYTL